jgi:hypothetical protein
MKQQRSIRFGAAKARKVRLGLATETRRRVKLGTVEGSLDSEDGVLSLPWPRGKRGGRLSCPYGEVGEVLWVQEPWMPGGAMGKFKVASTLLCLPDGPLDLWRPAWQMPFAACLCRIITTGIVVEPLQAITYEGVLREGFGSFNEFREIWADLHGLSSWEENEFVFVISFKLFDHRGAGIVSAAGPQEPRHSER